MCGSSMLALPNSQEAAVAVDASARSVGAGRSFRWLSSVEEEEHEAVAVVAGEELEPMKGWVRWCTRRQLQISAGSRDKDPETESFPVYELTAGAARLRRGFRALETAPCHWDRKYANAQKIFGESDVYRQKLRAEKEALFGNSGARREEREVASGDDLMRLMSLGMRNGRPQVYSFVILDDGVVRICESAAMVMHASKAGAVEEVWGAGEMWFQHARGRYWLCLSNNSGTYKPALEDMRMIAAFFSEVVGGDFEVEMLLRDDPKVEEYWLEGNFKGDPVHMPRRPNAAAEQPAVVQQSSQVKVLRPARVVHQHAGATVPQAVSSVSNSMPVAAWSSASAMPVQQRFTHQRVRSCPTWQVAPHVGLLQGNFVHPTV